MGQRLEAIQRGATHVAAPTERGETTRRHILEVAARAFAEKGYAGASLNDLIREADLTKGAFYFHFPSKEALAIAVLRHKQEQWASRVLSATLQHTTAIDRMNAMVEELIDVHENDPTGQAISRICQELAEDPELIPQLAPQFSAWVDMTASLFAQAQEEGTVRPDLDPHAMGEVAVAAFLGMELMSKVEGTGLGPRVRRYVELFTTAFRTPDGA